MRAFIHKSLLVRGFEICFEKNCNGAEPDEHYNEGDLIGVHKYMMANYLAQI